MLSKLVKMFKTRFKKYDPKKYWSVRVNPNNKEGETVYKSRHTNYIKKYTKGFYNCFELGAGVGRTFEVYEKGANLTCLDISRTYEKQACEKAKTLGLKFSFVELIEPNSSFPFNDETFGIGVASQVFLHVPHNDIEHYISECLRICDKLIVISAYLHSAKASKLGQTANHVFNHNYMEICTSLGFRMDDVQWSDGQIYFVISK